MFKSQCVLLFRFEKQEILDGPAQLPALQAPVCKMSYNWRLQRQLGAPSKGSVLVNSGFGLGRGPPYMPLFRGNTPSWLTL